MQNLLSGMMALDSGPGHWNQAELGLGLSCGHNRDFQKKSEFHNLLRLNYVNDWRAA